MIVAKVRSCSVTVRRSTIRRGGGSFARFASFWCLFLRRFGLRVANPFVRKRFIHERRIVRDFARATLTGSSLAPGGTSIGSRQCPLSIWRWIDCRDTPNCFAVALCPWVLTAMSM